MGEESAFPGPVTFGVKVTRDDGPGGHVHFDIFAGRNPHARGRAGSWCLRHDEFEAFIARLKPDAPLQFACICDPSDLFDPPDPTPRAVHGCPAHWARRAFQKVEAEMRGASSGVLHHPDDRAGGENTDG